jgi:hypothetical protein
MTEGKPRVPEGDRERGIERAEGRGTELNALVSQINIQAKYRYRKYFVG